MWIAELFRCRPTKRLQPRIGTDVQYNAEIIQWSRRVYGRYAKKRGCSGVCVGSARAIPLELNRVYFF